MSAIHLVCHDCPAEALRDISPDYADTLVEFHKDANPSHDAEWGEV